MNEIAAKVLMHVCLWGVIAAGIALFAMKVAAPTWDAIKRWLDEPAIGMVLIAVFVIGIAQYGSTKSKIEYAGGIKAGETRSYTTNDTIYVSWQRDLSGGVYVPESAAVYIDYRPNTATNEEYGLLAETTVGAWSWTGTLENATNYDFSVWAYYIPPEPVHTNGVWVYKAMKDRQGKFGIPIRARIEVNGKAIATPKEKRKDEE